MNYSLSEALGSLKRNWKSLLSRSKLEELCVECGMEWRERILTPARTIELLLLQVLHGNTALSHVRYFVSRGFSASALCQARRRVPLGVFEKLLHATSAMKVAADLWRRRRVYYVDGSNFSMPDTAELRSYFGYAPGQREGCGFPVAHFVALVSATTGMIRRVLLGPLFSHDLSSFVKLHSELAAEDVLIGDRAFGSYCHIALLIERSVDVVFRVCGPKHVCFRGNTSTTIREKRLGTRDQIVRWLKPKHPPVWMSAEQFDAIPAELCVRELAYPIRSKGFRSRKVVLVTTLLDPKAFSVQELASLYQRRWEIETCFNNLKTTMRMNVLHCHSVNGVLKEFISYCIVHNLIRAVMAVTAIRLGVELARVSFVDSLRWLLAAASRLVSALPRTMPARPKRSEPRAVKRRPKEFDLLNKPRAAYACA